MCAESFANVPIKADDLSSADYSAMDPYSDYKPISQNTQSQG